jgi:cytochrome c553
VKRWTLIFGVGLLALGLLGFLVAASGIIPVKASSGHWRITEWFLHFSMQRSASTHTLGMKVPPLDDPALVRKGAGHYDLSCRSCHGAPGLAAARTAQAMLPRPVDLVAAVPRSNPRKLFHIVKHGVKFTGMPAFPTQERDDEVWSVVAFLLALPRLDAADYRRLSGRDAVAVESGETIAGPPGQVMQSCSQCHGRDGIGPGGTIPRLAGQRGNYLREALLAYRRGDRPSGIMESAVAGLDEATIRQLADHYAALPPAAPESKSIDDQDPGRLIAREGIRSRRVPACLECHDPGGRRANPAYPRLDGQPAGYLALQLQLFQDGRRGGSAHAHLMNSFVSRLTPAEIDALARYFSSLAAGESREPAASR